MTVLAKENGITLQQHTEDVFEVYEKIKSYIKEELHKPIEIAIIFHDFGKVIPSFQIKGLGNNEYSPWDVVYEIPHSIFSAFWIKKDELVSLVKDDHQIANFIISAISYHHWRDSFEKYLRGRNKDFITLCNKVFEWKEELERNIKNEICDLKGYQNLFGLNERWLKGIINGRSFLDYAIPPYKFDYEPLREEFNEKWVLISGFLQRCDHFASFCEEEGEGLDKVEIEPLKASKVNENIIKEVQKKNDNVNGITLWQIKDTKEKRDKNLILVAPTGSGKTEFAYLWGAGNKMFITLPLRSAVNATYQRSKDIFGKNNVGLLHSDADVYLYEKSLNYEGENFRVLDLSKQLSLPVLVSTGDQIFPSALKYPGYEKIYSTLGYSRLVIDEVQAYDPKAAAIIVKLIEDIVKLGGKFLLMTATLPPFVKQEIEDRIGKENFELVDKYNPNDDVCKHKIEVREDDITKMIDEILNKAEEGKRVLVILNTVETAQRVYEEIAKVNTNNIYLKLIHSRFTFNDRKRLEDEIVGTIDKKGTFENPKPDSETEGKILVATQVVEASLDIDADILYTELAPIDSLVQRMGRVLRRIRDKESYEKYLGDEELAEPNIIIFYQKPDEDNRTKLTSGAGSVYQKDLLAFSLALLFRKGNLITNDNIEKLKDKYWPEEKEERKDALKGFLEDLFEIVENNSDNNFCIGENYKNKLVEELYNLLPPHSGYLQRFYETLEILDAGYMSDRKTEALKLFREIYTVPAIPEERINNFKQSIENYLRGNEFSYTLFKIKVLSEYVVNIDIRKYLYDNSLNLKDASYILYEIKEVNDEQANKIKNWLSGVYVFDGEYDSKLGVTFSDGNKKRESQNSGIIDI